MEDTSSGNSLVSIGVMLAREKRFEEAEAAFRREIELHPDSPAAWSNLAVLQISLKQESCAELSCRRAMELDPDFKNTYLNLSYLLLRQGRYEEGWRCLEERNIHLALEKSLPCPRWRGESLKGSSLLMGFEEGYGDMIQFCRYAAVLKQQGVAKITLICQPSLKTLLASMKEFDELFACDEILPPRLFDYWTMPVALPHHCRTLIDSIPACIPYLHADKTLVEKWSSLLAEECLPTDFRVGLVWKGNPLHDNDEERSLPGLKTLEPLGTITGVRFFSLQKGAGEEEAAAPPAELPMVNLGPMIADFADSAAIVANMDLIISVDTAMVHLAGALGKSCFVLLSDFKTDWRWLTGRDDSPWYPGVLRLFRQRRTGDWGSVADDVGAAVRLLLERTPLTNTYRVSD